MGNVQTALELSDDRTCAKAYNGEDATVSVPDSVKTLAPSLFAGCTHLQSVKLPAGLKVLPERLFYGCTALERVRLPQEIKQTGEACFAHCSSLKSAPLCPGMTEIARNMFKGCKGIDAFAVPDGIKVIKQGAFAGCTGLETLILSASVEKIEEGAFEGCTSLRRIRVSDDNLAYYMEENDGFLRNKSDGEIVLSPVQSTSQTAGLLHSEDEIDTSEDETEEDTVETLEAMDNNFIGDEDEEAENTDKAESAQKIENEEDKKEIMEDKTSMDSIDDKLADIMGRPRAAESAAASADEVERIALESDILKQNILHQEKSEGDTLAADDKELGRIALESDILKQNIGAEDAEPTPLAADKKELERVVFESDILSQNTKGGSEASVGMDELILLSKESEIMRENTKVSNRITLTPTEAAAKVDGEELDEEEKPLVIISKAEESDDGAESRDSVLERMKNIAQKYECIETAGEDMALFVFAEKLSGAEFSSALTRCAKRLAAIHDLNKIHLFYGLPFDHAEFMQMFGQFILGKNAIYACDSESTKSLSASARAFAAASNVALNKESMAEQMARAQEKGGRSFRLILQDDYR